MHINDDNGLELFSVCDVEGIASCGTRFWPVKTSTSENAGSACSRRIGSSNSPKSALLPETTQILELTRRLRFGRKERAGGQIDYTRGQIFRYRKWHAWTAFVHRELVHRHPCRPCANPGIIQGDKNVFKQDRISFFKHKRDEPVIAFCEWSIPKYS